MIFPIGDLNILAGATDVQIADWIEARLAKALSQTEGSVSIALPGGSTPFPILDILKDRPLEWDRVVVYPTDDRMVEEDHPASNTGKLRALLEPAGCDVTPLQHAEQSGGQAAIPVFALVWLGMGADGHIASLFPNADPQANDPLWIRRLTPDPLPPEAPFDRITLTIPALLNCNELVFVVRGEDKRAVLGAALAGENDLPIARLLSAASPPVTCFT
jgi:6-phosphogluconolactonase